MTVIQLINLGSTMCSFCSSPQAANYESCGSGTLKNRNGKKPVMRFRFLRASLCKYRKSGDSFIILNFFIFCPNKAFSELFAKIQLKDTKALEFFQNRGKFENRHFGLPPPLKIDKNDAFSFRSCW